MTNPTYEQLLVRVQELEAAKNNKRPSGVLSIGKKGGVSMSIEGSWPVTQTAARWRYILSQGPAILKFIKEHKSELAGETVEEVKA